MESTGVYWRPVYAVLEEHFERIVGNARHIRNVPGRKTDVKDFEWIADLVRHGLIAKSFVPPPPLRELREHIRLRTILVGAAISASRAEGSYLKDKFHRLKRRRGAIRAALAIAHKILVSTYHMLSTAYLAANSAKPMSTRSARPEPSQTSSTERLGYRVTLEPNARPCLTPPPVRLS
jgi:transposase